MLEDGHVDDTVHDHDHLFVSGGTPIGNGLCCNRRRYHDH
jgi:hypothetical protein